MTYGIDFVNRAIKRFFSGESNSKIARELEITRKTVYKWRMLYSFNITNKIFIEKLKKPYEIHGNNKRIKERDKILLFVKENKGCSLFDIYHYIETKISMSSINKVLKENGITHKKIGRRIISENNEKKRILFCKEVNIEDYKDGIFIDEVGFTLSDKKRYGYSLKGEPISNNDPVLKHKKNNKRVSVLMAMHRSGIVLYELIYGTVNSESFLNFLDTLKHQLSGSTIYLDNASIHTSKKVLNLLKTEDINYKFLSPYSPDFNPIEFLFNSTKTTYRTKRNKYLIELDNIISENTKLEIDGLIIDSINSQDNVSYLTSYVNHSLEIINEIKKRI